MVKGQNCKINSNLQLGERIVLGAAKYKTFTLFLVQSKRCRARLMHSANIPLELLQCTSGQMAFRQVSWDITVYMLTDMPVGKSKRLTFG